MSHDTGARLFNAVAGMLLQTMVFLPLVRQHLVPLWAYGVVLAVSGVAGLLSPEIERAWARSKWPPSDWWLSRRR